MAFNVRKRGKITYYYTGDYPVVSAMTTEEQPDGDLRICFSGLTGGYSAKGVLGLDELVKMEPLKEIPLVFKCWEKWLQEAGICNSISEVDFIEMHAFGSQPKQPSPMVEPLGYAEERKRLSKDYGEAYSKYFRETWPDGGGPARFTVHVVDVPDTAASYEFYGVALYQKSLKEKH